MRTATPRVFLWHCTQFSAVKLQLEKTLSLEFKKKEKKETKKALTTGARVPEFGSTISKEMEGKGNSIHFPTHSLTSPPLPGQATSLQGLQSNNNNNNHGALSLLPLPTHGRPGIAPPRLPVGGGTPSPLDEARGSTRTRRSFSFPLFLHLHHPPSALSVSIQLWLIWIPPRAWARASAGFNEAPRGRGGENGVGGWGERRAH